MVKMSFAKRTSMYCKLYRIKLNNLTDKRLSFPSKRCFSQKLTSFQLLPEVEQLLDSGSVKHRQHPGVNKTPPIILPPTLISAVDKLISDQNERILLKEADELLKCLETRRLPIENNELEWRLKNIVQSYEDEDEPTLLTKGQKVRIKKEISSELKRWKPIEYNHQQCLAYLVGRIAANYASVYKVFSQIKAMLPTFQPKTFFDFGSGVGSAVWAAHSVWSESIHECFCVDASSDMNNISQALLNDEALDEKLIKNICHRQFLPASESIKYDLVVSAFSLMDLPSAKDRLRVIDILWRKTTDILVIIEFGNLAGFYSVLDARDYILQVENQPSTATSLYSSGAHVLMPCPHELLCPMLERTKKRSCGIHVPYESLFPRHSKECKKDWISYIVLRKGHRYEDSSWPRIVMPVLKRPKHVYCRVCCKDGKLNELIVTKSRHGRHGYRCARSSTLGDSLPVNIELPTHVVDSQKSNNEDA